MASTATDVVNLAFDEIGRAPIDSIDEDISDAKRAKRQYLQARPVILSVGAWSCAKRKAVLARDADAPAFGWNYQHQLPADFLRVWEINQNPEPEFEINGSLLLSNYSTVNLTYIADITDVSQMHPLLVQTLAQWIAAKMAKALTGDVSRRRELLQEAQQTMLTAISVDALQLPPTTHHGSAFLKARE